MVNARAVSVHFAPGLISHQKMMLWGGLAWLLAAELLLALSLAVVGPSTTVLVAVLLAAPAALFIRAEHLIYLALGALFFSRLLVMFGGPSTLNFAHFPIALLAFIKLLERPADDSNGRLITWLIVLLALTMVSSALTSWEAFRPLISWITLGEPFIFFGLVASLPDEEKMRLRTFALLIAVIQIPFAVGQFGLHGIGDGVQGTLLGQGAGHHIMAAAAIVAGWVLLSAPGRRGRLPVGLLALVLLAIGVLADAKQVYAALIAAILLAGLLQGRQVGRNLLLPGAVMIGIVIASAQLYAPMERVLNREIVAQLAGDKLEQASVMIEEVGAGNSLLGLGAGNGISRTALTSVPAYGSVPPLLIGEVSELAIRELYAFDTIRDSSATSPFSSWLGIYTDLGLLGIAAFVALAICVVKSLQNADEMHRRASYVLLMLAGLLGFVFTWLEEPAFTVYLAVLLATGVRSTQSTGPRGLIVALDGVSRSWSAFRRRI